MEAGAYVVILSKTAQKSYRKYQGHFQKAFEKAFGELQINPHTGVNIKKLINLNAEYRYRIGDLRIAYDANDEDFTVYVIDIQPRGQAYKNKR